jgi:AraC-like DNA-binding protein
MDLPPSPFLTALDQRSPIDAQSLAALVLPGWGAAGVVGGVMHRRYAPEADAAGRSSFFPAVPLCGLHLFKQGHAEALWQAGAWRDVAGWGEWVFSGPAEQPAHTRAAPGTEVWTLFFLPDILARASGIRLADWLDQTVPAQAVLPQSWLAQLPTWAQARTPQALMEAVEHWVAVDADAQAPLTSGRRYRDWLIRVSMKARQSSVGRSVRQFERRMKDWTGLSERRLKVMARAEAAFFEVKAQQEQGLKVDWADLAASLDYADQAHLIRETVKTTGFPPSRLAELIATDERFWTYRIWA